MSDPFADASDLAALGFTSDLESDVLDAICDDASEHLRGIIGQRVYPQQTSTITMWIGCGPQRVRVPVRPLISLDSVTVNGVVVQHPRRIGDSIRVCGPGELVIQATHGYADVPEELRSWTCVMAAEAAQRMETLGQLGSGGVTSVSIDDFRQAWSATSSEDAAAWSLPASVRERLAAQYGGGAVVTGVLE